MDGGYSLAVASAKGGVGKTTTSINVGAALAATNRSVLVVELDLAMANLLDFLDLGIDADRDPTLHEVLAGDAAPAEAIHPAPGGFDVLPCGVSLDGFAKADPVEVAAVLESLRPEYEAIVLDTGAGVSYETLFPLGVADGVVLVTTPRVAAVRDTMKTIDLAERVGGTPLGAVVVKTGSGSAPDAERIAEFLGVDLLGAVPEDAAIPTSQDAGMPVLAHDIASPAAKAYWEAAARIHRAVTRTRSNSGETRSPARPLPSD